MAWHLVGNNQLCESKDIGDSIQYRFPSLTGSAIITMPKGAIITDIIDITDEVADIMRSV